MDPISGSIQLATYESSAWTGWNGILLEGQLSIVKDAEFDDIKIKIGDGATSWTELQFFNPTPVLSDVLGREAKTDDIAITSTNEKAQLRAFDELAGFSFNNGDAAGAVTATALLTTVEHDIEIVLNTLTLGLQAETINFSATAYNFSGLDTDSGLALDSSGNLITYTLPDITSPVDSTNLGWGPGVFSSITAGALYNIAIGSNTLNSLTTGINNIAIGDTAGQTLTTGSSNIFIGDDTYANDPTITYSIAIGPGVHLTESNQLIIGSSAAPIQNAYIGQGAAHGDAKLWVGALNLYNATVDSIVGIDSSKNLIALDTATYPTLLELSYVKGATSNLQSQITALALTELSCTGDIDGVNDTFLFDWPPLIVIINGQIKKSGGVGYNQTGSTVVFTDYIPNTGDTVWAFG